MTTQEPNTPAAQGFAMPAEWDTHAATWLAWPHNVTDWPGKIVTIHWAYGEMIRKIVPGEKMRLIVQSARHEARARQILKRVGADSDRVEFFHFPTNRGWARDFGPIFVRRDAEPKEVAIARFRFNAWAKYPDWQLDGQVAERAAQALGRRVFPVRYGADDIVLEGGAIDVNGCGALLTTEECLLDDQVQVRNPNLNRNDVEQVLHDYLGADHVLWLGRGIAGDDTHGHVDDLCRFVAPGTVVLCREPNPADENHAVLEENRERLEGVRLTDGSRLEVIRLPMPAPLYLDGMRLPASYANFYIANAAVLVPTFNDPNDRIALGILSELFPDRPVVGIHAVDLVLGQGTIHCLSQQEPAV